MIWSQSFTKIIGIHFGNSIFNNNDWDKINDHIHKKIIFGTGLEWDSLWEGRLCQNYRSNVYHFKIHQKGNCEKGKQFHLEWQKY